MNNDSFKNGLAGLTAHLSTGLIYPLELLKIRLQGNDNCYSVNEERKSLRKLTSDIYSKEGMKGFYRGFFFSIFAGCLANAMFFWKYNLFK